MTHREEVQEQYEDALFALLMDDMAQEQGAAYETENERLKQEPEFSAPDKTDQRMLKAIRSIESKRRVKSVLRGSYKVISRVSVAVVAVLLLSVTALALFPQLRTYLLNITVKALPESIDYVSYTDDSANFVYHSISGVELGYFPDDYVLVTQQQAENLFSSSYENTKGDYIDISVSTGVGVTSVDTEDAEVRDIAVQGYEGTAIDKKRVFHAIVWTDTEHNCNVLLISSTLTTDELLPIAEELEIIR